MTHLKELTELMLMHPLSAVNYIVGWSYGSMNINE